MTSKYPLVKPLASRFRDMLVAQAVDVVQPNVCITGGYTQCLRIAGMAAASGETLQPFTKDYMWGSLSMTSYRAA